MALRLLNVATIEPMLSLLQKIFGPGRLPLRSACRCRMSSSRLADPRGGSGRNFLSRRSCRDCRPNSSPLVLKAPPETATVALPISTIVKQLPGAR